MNLTDLAGVLISVEFSFPVFLRMGVGRLMAPAVSGGADGNVDSVSEGEKAVTALLKALQKTILFEKEMTAWLTRDFGTKFMDPSMTAQLVIGGGGENSKEAELGDINNGDNDLGFDEHGRAVAAKSAEGIKIKYERRKSGDDASYSPVVWWIYGFSLFRASSTRNIILLLVIL